MRSGKGQARKPAAFFPNHPATFSPAVERRGGDDHFVPGQMLLLQGERRRQAKARVRARAVFYCFARKRNQAQKIQTHSRANLKRIIALPMNARPKILGRFTRRFFALGGIGLPGHDGVSQLKLLYELFSETV